MIEKQSFGQYIRFQLVNMSQDLKKVCFHVIKGLGPFLLKLIFKKQALLAQGVNIALNCVLTSLQNGFAVQPRGGAIPSQLQQQQLAKQDPKKVIKRLMEGRWTALVKGRHQEAINKFVQVFKETIAQEVKKEMNCEQCYIHKIWMRKTKTGFVYWVYLRVDELGNQSKYTLMLKQWDQTLIIVDLFQDYLVITNPDLS